MTKPIIKGYSPEWGSVVGGLRTGQFSAIGTSDEIISQLLYVSITGGFTGTVNLERFVGGSWAIVDTYTSPETVLFENPKALRMRLNCISLTAGSVLYGIEDVYATPTATAPVPVGGGGGGTVTVGDSATFDTRADALLATVDASVNWIKTEGFSVVGDFGAGTYKKLSGAPTLTTSKAYIHTANNIWFGLVPSGGRELYLAQFGGKADFAGTPGTATDNLPIIQDATSYVAYMITAVEVFAYRICLGFGKYWFSAMLELRRHIHIMGMNLEEDIATECWWPNTTTCIMISQNNTTGEYGVGSGLSSGNSTTLEAFGIKHHYATGGWVKNTYTACHGVNSRAVCRLINLSFVEIAGHAIYIHGSSGYGGVLEGAPNQWHVRDCAVHSCSGHGLAVAGADANAGSAVGFSTHQCGGCGIYNDTYFANTYTGVHIAGYGRRGVRDGNIVGVSRTYQLIDGIGNSDPNWNPSLADPTTHPRVWQEHGVYDGSTFSQGLWPLWVSGGTGPNYDMYQSPIWDSGGGSVYTGIYIETTETMAHVKPASLLLGGSVAATPGSSYLATNTFLASRQGVGAQQFFNPGTTEYTRNGPTTWAAMGLPHDVNGLGPNGGLQFLSFRRQSDADATWQWGFQGNDIGFRSETNAQILEITTRSTTQEHGRNMPDRYKLRLFAPVFVDPGDSGNARIVGVRSTAPSGAGDAGGHARGDRYYNVNASAGGFEGWVCTTGGAIHNTVWSSGVAIDGNTIMKNSANRVYKLTTQGIGAGTSTIEPVHTSGSVTDAQGNVWLWIADGPPTFKQFGTIAA